MASFFGDVFKSTEDFFAKTFNYNNMVEVTAAGANDMSFTFEGGIKKKDDKPATGYSSMKVVRKSGPVSVKKITIDTEGKLKGEIEFPDIAPSTKGTFKFEDGSRTSKADISATFGVETSQDLGVAAGISAEVDVVKATASGSVLVNHEGILVGGSGAVDTHFHDKEKKSAEVTGYDVLVGYQSGGTTFALQTADKLESGTVFLHNKVNPDFTVTGTAKLSLKKGSKKGTLADVEFGGTYKWDDSTTLHAAVNRKAEVQFAFCQKVNPTATFNIYTMVNANKLEHDAHKFGSKISLRA